jgi:hypothetical protein
MGFLDVVIESDSANVVRALHRKDLFPETGLVDCAGLDSAFLADTGSATAREVTEFHV